MGTLLCVDFPDGSGRMLYEHEGWLEFLDSATNEWSSGWGQGLLGSPGHDPLRVRAGCECGWRGVSLPWSAEDGHPTDDQRDVLLAYWERHHAGPPRDEAVAAGRG